MTVFFVDRSLGRNEFSRVLVSAGLVVKLHDDEFPQDAADVEWIEAAANRGWVAIAADESVVTRRIEVEAIRRHKARILVPGLRKRPARERAELFVLAVPQIRRFVTKEAPPWVARVVPARERSVKKPRVTRLQLPET